MQYTKGQVVITTTIISAWLLASVGAWIAQNKALEAKIDDRTEILRNADLSQVQRVSTLEEAVQTIKSDNGEMKKDIKEILRAVK